MDPYETVVITNTVHYEYVRMCLHIKNKCHPINRDIINHHLIIKAKAFIIKKVTVL